MTVAAVILAAGRGTRFGVEPKLLAQLDGKPLVRHVAEAAAGSSARPVLAVAGHRAGEVESHLAGLPLTIVRNPDYAQGLSTSLKAGFLALPGSAPGAIVLLGDMPRVSAALIDALCAAWAEAGAPAALVPVFRGRRGNPAVLSATLRPAIMDLSGDAGAGPILRGREDVVEWATDDPAVVQDVDTPEALGALGNLPERR
jgi:molybdenum cofactor cytidylyltransferase